MRYILTFTVLCLTVLAQPKTGEATLTMYYPDGTKPETVRVLEVLVKIQGGCVSYTHQGDDIVFCGTFKMIRAK